MYMKADCTSIHSVQSMCGVWGMSPGNFGFYVPIYNYMYYYRNWFEGNFTVRIIIITTIIIFGNNTIIIFFGLMLLFDCLKVSVIPEIKICIISMLN